MDISVGGPMRKVVIVCAAIAITIMAIATVAALNATKRFDKITWQW